MEQSCDIIGDLLSRNLISIVEEILYLTDAKTITNCFKVSRYWEQELTGHKLWKRMVDLRFIRNKKFRICCGLNGWKDSLTSQGGEERPSQVYKQMQYKITRFNKLMSDTNYQCKKLYTGSMFTCLIVQGNNLFAGMTEGLIKMWNIQLPMKSEKPVKIFEGHEDRVTALDCQDGLLFSSSDDHSVRIWNTETGGLLRVLRGPGNPLLLLKLTKDRIITLSRSGQLSFWYWAGLQHVEYLYSTSVDHDVNFLDVGMGNNYIVMILHDPFLSGETELQVFSSKTGRRLPEKKIISNAMSCINILNDILAVGSKTMLELWNLEDCQMITSLEANYLETRGLVYIKQVTMSDYALVAMLSTGSILVWELLECLKGKSSAPSLHISNTERCWKNIIVVSDSKIIFGLEMKFGDIKIFSFSGEKEVKKEDHLEEEPKGIRLNTQGCAFSCCNFIPKHRLLGSLDSIPDLK